MNDRSAWFSLRSLHLVLALLACIQAVVAQTHNRYIFNDSAVTKFWRLEYKSDATSGVWISIANGSRLAGQNTLLDSVPLNCIPSYPGAAYQVEWYTGSLGAVGSGETTGSWRINTGAWTSGPYSLACGGSGTVDQTYRHSGAAPTEWCFKDKIVNYTFTPQQYEIFYVTNGGGRSLEAMVWVNGNSELLVSVGPKAQKGVLEVLSKPTRESVYLGDGQYAAAPPGMVEFVPASHAAWYGCSSSPSATNTSVHRITVEQAPDGEADNLLPYFANQNLNNTNAVDRDTFSRGIIGIASLDAARNDKANANEAEMLRLLGQVNTNLAQIRTNSTATSTNQHVAGSSQISTNWSDYLVGGSSERTSGSNTLTQPRASVGAMTNFTGIDGSGHDPSFWVLQLPEFGEVDLNPMSVDGLSSLASWHKDIWNWLSYVGLFVFIAHSLIRAIQAQGAYQQGRAPNVGVTIAGFGFQTTLLAHIAIVVLVAAILVALLTVTGVFYNSTVMLTAIATNYFSSSYPPIVEGLWLLNQFFDLPVLLANLGAALTFMIVLATASFVSQMMIRALPGCILLCFLQLDSEAAIRLQFQNRSGTNCMVSLNLSPLYTVRDGGDLFLEGGTGDLHIWDMQTNEIIGWFSNWDTADRRVLAVLGSDLHVVDEPTFEAAFYTGLSTGGVIFMIVGVVWLWKVSSRAAHIETGL